MKEGRDTARPWGIYPRQWPTPEDTAKTRIIEEKTAKNMVRVRRCVCACACVCVCVHRIGETVLKFKTLRLQHVRRFTVQVYRHGIRKLLNIGDISPSARFAQYHSRIEAQPPPLLYLM